jgi:hypothetical protein
MGVKFSIVNTALVAGIAWGLEYLYKKVVIRGEVSAASAPGLITARKYEAPPMMDHTDPTKKDLPEGTPSVQ